MVGVSFVYFVSTFVCHLFIEFYLQLLMHWNSKVSATKNAQSKKITSFLNFCIINCQNSFEQQLIFIYHDISVIILILLLFRHLKYQIMINQVFVKWKISNSFFVVCRGLCMNNGQRHLPMHNCMSGHDVLTVKVINPI